MNEITAIYWLLVVICVLLIIIVSLLEKRRKDKRQIRLLDLALKASVETKIVSEIIKHDNQPKSTNCYKEVFLMDRAKGMTYKQIANKYWFKENTVAHAIQRWCK